MPELPEVEITCRGISPHIIGNQINEVLIRNAKMRIAIPEHLPSTLKNQTITVISRRAKYICARFHHGSLILHLGMSGTLRITDQNDLLKKHDHFIVNFANHKSLRLNDPRRFGMVDRIDKDLLQHKIFENLGPEPLTELFSPKYFTTKINNRNTAIKLFIMDPKIVVGVGNIYANEALFLSKINPTLPAKNLTAQQIITLVKNIKQVLLAGINAGGTTLRDFTNADGKPGYFQQQLNVYGREGLPCVACQTVLSGIRQGQRATVYCGSCQK